MRTRDAAPYAATVKGLRDERDAAVAMNFLNVLGLTPSLRVAGGQAHDGLSLERLGLVSPSHDQDEEETGLFARSVDRQ